jgi:hypothetical protein
LRDLDTDTKITEKSLGKDFMELVETGDFLGWAAGGFLPQQAKNV